jgi:hypothetical protein
MKFLIAYNVNTSDNVSGHFEFCGEEIQEEAQEHGIEHIILVPPFLKNRHLLSHLPTCQVCFIASHGDASSIAGDDEDIVSVQTENTPFSGKLLYAISCSCGKALMNALVDIGLRSFWGYNSELKIWSGYPHYARCSLTGLKSLIAGKTIKEAKEEMLACYDQDIAELESEYPDNPILAADLLDNKESLVVYGSDCLTLNDFE